MRNGERLQRAHLLALEWERRVRGEAKITSTEAPGNRCRVTVTVPHPCPEQDTLTMSATAAGQLGALELAHLELRNAAIAHFATVDPSIEAFDARAESEPFDQTTRSEQLVAEACARRRAAIPDRQEIHAAFARARIDQATGELSIGTITDAVLARRAENEGLAGQAQLL